jgi:hypothetical protein
MEYRDRVFLQFLTMEVGEEFDLVANVNSKNMDLFIETCKQLIDEDLMPLHYILFSDNYTSMKKKLKIF